MPLSDPARTPDILRKRVRRLLRLDHRSEDQNEISARILPFLRSLGAVTLMGGAIRDLARAGRKGFASDLDFVVYGSDRSDFATQMERNRGLRNKFGGYSVPGFGWKVDVWHLEDTWAKTAGHVNVTTPAHLLECTFFDWDSAVYDVSTGRVIVPRDYFDILGARILDIRLAENPNPRGSLVRALRRAALWGVKFGPRLTEFSKRAIRDMPWKDLCELDSRAFHTSVLKHLDRVRLLERLETPLDSSSGVTLPVSAWVPQLHLGFDV